MFWGGWKGFVDGDGWMCVYVQAVQQNEVCEARRKGYMYAIRSVDADDTLS